MLDIVNGITPIYVNDIAVFVVLLYTISAGYYHEVPLHYAANIRIGALEVEEVVLTILALKMLVH